MFSTIKKLNAISSLSNKKYTILVPDILIQKPLNIFFSLTPIVVQMYIKAVRMYGKPGKTWDRSSFINLILTLSLSVRLAVLYSCVQRTDCNPRDILMQFCTQTCFDPTANTIEKGFDRTTFSTASHIIPRSEKTLIWITVSSVGYLITGRWPNIVPLLLLIEATEVHKSCSIRVISVIFMYALVSLSVRPSWRHFYGNQNYQICESCVLSWRCRKNLQTIRNCNKYKQHKMINLTIIGKCLRFTSKELYISLLL